MTYNTSSQWTNSNVPYSSSYQIKCMEYTKHYNRVVQLDGKAKADVAKGKYPTYKEACESLSIRQAKKITTPEKAYGRYLVAQEHGFYDIATGFLSKYRHLTQTRSDKIANILEDL